MLEIVEKKTVHYQVNSNKKIRKSKGQFFTPLNISKYMASLASLANIDKEDFKVLDCGAGLGVLGFSVLDVLITNGNVRSICIDFYENDKEVLPMLYSNIEKVKEKIGDTQKNIELNVIEENFITFNEKTWKNKVFAGLYDVAISNPPYKKISKNDEEAIAMNDIVYGQPNDYFLFMAMSMHLLKEDGEGIFITPRSFTSGAYFRKFREYILNVSNLSDIHIFNSRNDVFKSETVLQEAVITKFVKGKDVKNVSITSTDNGDFDNTTKLKIKYSEIINMDSENKFILLPSSKDEVEILNKIHNWKYNLKRLGFQLKTGPVVDFRAVEFITNDPHNSVPLIWSDNFIENVVTRVDNEDNYRYILNVDKTNGLLLENRNYILIKRFTSKEERRRLQPALYLKDDFCEYEKVGIENHINYIKKLDGEIQTDELYGLFCLFNSTLLDKYYRIVNGSTQVNATETNLIPLPNLEKIKNLGKKLFEKGDLSVNTCDELINILMF